MTRVDEVTMLTITLQSSHTLYKGVLLIWILPVPHGPPMDAPLQHIEGVHVPEEAEDAVTKGVASKMQTYVQSYHPWSPKCSTTGNVS